MRLLYVLTHLAYGGAETQVVELARRFARRGWTVEVLSLMAADGLTDRLDDAGIAWSTLDVPRGVWSPRLVSGVVEAYRRFQPDVVHSHTLPANFAARTARALRGVPVLITSCHNLTEGGAARMAFYRATDRLADVTTNCSVSAVERYVRIGAAPAGRIRYVPNGIDTERFRPDAGVRERVRRALELGDAFTWLAVGRMTEQKDWPTLVEAARSMPDGDRLLVVGDGELADDVKARVATLGDRARWLGVRTDVDALMKAADGYLMSSAWEGLPVVLLEAAASGLPIAATRVGGNDQIVLDDVSGVLVEPGDAAALAGAMARIRTSGAGMGERGRAHVVASFGLDAVVAQWDAIYGEFLRGARVSSAVA